MNVFKLTFTFVLIILLTHLKGKAQEIQQNKTQLIIGAWTFDIEPMIKYVPEAQRESQKKMISNMQVVYNFILYLTNPEGITEELEIIELNQTHLTVKDTKGKTLFFIPYRGE